MNIRPLTKPDIKGLNALPPAYWNIDYESLILNHLDESFFHAFVLTINNKIVGTGNTFHKNQTGWLAHIIIEESLRGKGLGSKMTQYLVDFLTQQGCKTQLLIATDLGEPVYKKIGFEPITTYISFETEKSYQANPGKNIKKLTTRDLEKVIQLDEEINGENRSHLIHKYFKSGYGYFNSNELIGFYIPDFGRGLVIANSETAGIDLLNLKHAEKGQRTLVPVDNKAAIEFLENRGLKKGYICAKMHLGKLNSWKPECIYSYGSGYCG